MRDALGRVLALARQGWAMLLAVLFIIAISIGYVFLIVDSIVPAMQARDRVSTQVATARETLARAGATVNPDDWRARLAGVQTPMSASLRTFLSESQAGQSMQSLYDYANASAVTLAEWQTLPTSTGDAQDYFRVTRLRVRAQGSSRHLIEFVARVWGLARRGFEIESVNIAGDEAERATLTLTLAVYTSPYALTTPIPATAIPPLPAPTSSSTPTPTPIPYYPTSTPTPVPIPTDTATPTRTPTSPPFILYTVRPGDTLYSIARRYGTTVDAIVALNHLAGYTIYVGQQLQIPAP